VPTSELSNIEKRSFNIVYLDVTCQLFLASRGLCNISKFLNACSVINFISYMDRTGTPRLWLRVKMNTLYKKIHIDLTNSMEQSPSWEANSHSASQKMSSVLRNWKVYYRVYKSQPVVPILSQVIQSIPSHLSSHLRLGLSSGFQAFLQKCCMHITSPTRATCPAHLIRFI